MYFLGIKLVDAVLTNANTLKLPRTLGMWSN